MPRRCIVFFGQETVVSQCLPSFRAVNDSSKLLGQNDGGGGEEGGGVGKLRWDTISLKPRESKNQLNLLLLHAVEAEDLSTKLEDRIQTALV